MAVVLVGCASAPMTGKRELILVANDQRIVWDGDQLVDTGKRMSLPGHPAAMRARAR